MAFTMNTVQVTTGNVGTLVYLGSTRLAVEGAPEATMQSCPSPSGDSRCACHSARRTSVGISLFSPSPRRRKGFASPAKNNWEEGRFRFWFHHQTLEIDPSVVSEKMRPSGLSPATGLQQGSVLGSTKIWRQLYQKSELCVSDLNAQCLWAATERAWIWELYCRSASL